MILDVRSVKVPRFCLPGIDPQKMEIDLGVFCDGSAEASCTRIFARYTTIKGQVEASYITGSCRLARGGNTSAPKCETEAVLMGARLLDTVLNLFQGVTVKNIYLFSDSKIALGGLTSNSVCQKLFYSLRNHESRAILSNLQAQLFYVDSKSNEADIGSKLNLKQNSALQESYWRSSWLMKDPAEWPAEKYEFQADHTVQIQNPKLTVLKAQIQEGAFSELIQKHKSFAKCCYDDISPPQVNQVRSPKISTTTQWW